MYKFAVITGFLGAIKNRFLEYQRDRNLEDKLQIVKDIKGINGVELCYPKDFEDVDKLKRILNNYELEISAINFRARRNDRWLRGSFTSNKTKEREEVVKEFKQLIDIAKDMKVDKITTCPLNDGYDYLFELDYVNAYKYLEDTFTEITEYDNNIKICIEYKLNGPRVRTILGNVGETISFCKRINKNNIGVTLDFGHALLAKENPSQSLCLLEREKKLFYIHLNDNDFNWDWDLISGSYNFWQYIEFFYYLNRLNYRGYISHDIFPKEFSSDKTFETSFKIERKLIEISKRLDDKRIKNNFIEKNPSIIFEYLYSLL